MASGLTLVFGILQIVNFAHGQFYMIGAIALYWLYSVLGVSYFISMLLSMTIVGTIGIMVEIFFLRKLLKDSIVSKLGVVLGLMVGLEGLMELLFGDHTKNVRTIFQGSINLLNFRLPYERIAIILSSIIIMALLYYWIKFTKQGTATRAMAQDPIAAELMGVDVGTIRLFVMGIGGALAAAAGSLIAPVFFVSPYMGANAMLKSLIIITLGGMGSLPGAVLGGLILGLIESFGYTFLGNIAEMAGFILVILILLIRPQGLFGLPFEISK